MKDPNGVTTTGPIWSFTIYDPIGIFVGTYNVDEPAEGWSYIITTYKGSATTLTIGNGKASRYPAEQAMAGGHPGLPPFNMNLTANTYDMPKTNFGGGYEGQESGTLNPTTGQMIGNYTIWQNGKVIENR